LHDLELDRPHAPSRPARNLRPLPRGGSLPMDRAAAQALVDRFDAIASAPHGSASDRPPTRGKGATKAKAGTGTGRAVQMLEV